MKKKIWIFLIFFVLLGIGVGGYFYFTRTASKSFSPQEEQWLSNNKNNVIDIYMSRNIAGLTYMGEGLFFDFMEYVKEETGLSLNAVAYEPMGEIPEETYAVELVDEVEDSQIPILKDDYVLVTKEKHVYTMPQEIGPIKVGVLSADEEMVKKYLADSQIEWLSYETEAEMLEAFAKDDTTDETQLDGVVGLKTLYLDDILTNDYHIAYHISNMTKTYALTLSGNEMSDSILKKTFDNWNKSQFAEAYNTSLLSSYFSFKGITEKEAMALREKAYVYAFMENGSYDLVDGGRLKGTNYAIIKSFAEFANIDMEYGKHYDSKEAIEEAFSSGKVDFFFNTYTMDLENTYETVMPLKSEVVVLAPVHNFIPIHSISDMGDFKVLAVKGTKIEEYLNNQEIEVTSYDSLKEVLNQKDSDSLMVIDLQTYEYYRENLLESYKITYQFSLDNNYGYIINGENKVFSNLFDFYLEYMQIDTIVGNSYADIYIISKKEVFYIITIVVLAFLVLIQFVYNVQRVFVFFKNKKKKALTKDEKIRYIDSLTSLKNRAYLNDNIEKWDNSEVYPQIIIVVDLNNIAYINDNFGHEEGDKVITEAANILIQTQMPRSEIIRTDGNEFLIYLVEYEEKQAVSYIRRLNKELKELSHGFGAATGYSVITDAIKTIDDAVNEATLDMRTNKEAMTEEDK